MSSRTATENRKGAAEQGGKEITTFVATELPPDLAESLHLFLTDAEVETTRAATIRAALRDYLKRKEYYPPRKRA